MLNFFKKNAKILYHPLPPTHPPLFYRFTDYIVNRIYTKKLTKIDEKYS